MNLDNSKQIQPNVYNLQGLYIEGAGFDDDGVIKE